MMQRLSQGITAANGLMAPLQQTSARLTAVKTELQALVGLATSSGLLGTPDTGYHAPPATPANVGLEILATSINLQIRGVMAQANASDHAGWAQIVSAVAGLLTAGASLYGAFAGPEGSKQHSEPPEPPPPLDPPGDFDGGDFDGPDFDGGGFDGGDFGAGGGSLAGVGGSGVGGGALGPGAAQPMSSAAVSAAAATRLAAASAGGAVGAGMGGYMYPPMMGAGRGEGDQSNLTTWRVTEDETDIFAALPDPTGGVLG
jgi:hypothetical protein